MVYVGSELSKVVEESSVTEDVCVTHIRLSDEKMKEGI